ncbi:MAG: tyrosine-type recombinase/integrase [Limisphaerales bacterium]
MAITALYNYAAAQNGNHEVSIVSPGTQSAPLLSLSEELAQASTSSADRTARPPPATRAGVSLNMLVERYRAESKHLAKSTRETMDCHFKVAGHFLDFERAVADIRLADIRKLRSELADGHKPSTTNDIIFKGLGALFKLALDDGHIEKSPLERLSRAKKGEPERQQPTWEQSLQLVEAVTRSGPETGIIVGFMRHFGVGQAEIKYLKGEHIDFERSEIHFRRKKTGKCFDVPIFPHAKAFVEALKNQGRLQTDRPLVQWRNPRKTLETACKELGLPVFSPRALRRTFIIHCLEEGVDPRVVAQWQGHRDASLIFKVYGKYVSKEHALRMAEKLT